MFLIDSSAEACPRPIRLGDSSRKHRTELARGRLENSHSEPIIQRATAILQVAPLFPHLGRKHRFYLVFQLDKLLDRHRLQRHTHVLRYVGSNNTPPRKAMPI